METCKKIENKLDNIWKLLRAASEQMKEVVQMNIDPNDEDIIWMLRTLNMRWTLLTNCARVEKENIWNKLTNIEMQAEEAER